MKYYKYIKIVIIKILVSNNQTELNEKNCNIDNLKVNSKSIINNKAPFPN